MPPSRNRYGNFSRFAFVSENCVENYVLCLLWPSTGIISALDNTKLCILVLLDFSKAFDSDSVNHEILLSILHYAGFGSDALSLLSNYFTDI